MTDWKVGDPESLPQAYPTATPHVPHASREIGYGEDMTIKGIEKMQTKANIKFETARKIRQLLDDARKEYGPEWSDDGVEADIIELVTEE